MGVPPRKDLSVRWDRSDFLLFVVFFYVGHVLSRLVDEIKRKISVC